MIPEGCESRCPGCAHRDWPYPESLRQKEAFLRDKISASVSSEKIGPIRGDETWSYRGSIFLRTEYRDGRWIAGVLKKLYRDEEIVPIPRCPVHRPGLNASLARALELLRDHPRLPLFGLLVRGHLLTLVIKSAKTSVIAETLGALPWSSCGFKGVHANYHASAGNRILNAKGGELLWGERWGEMETGQGKFRYGPSSFLQQIPSLHEESLQLAEEFFVASPAEGILDLYCGIGLSIARWKNLGLPVLGVESAGESVECAGAMGDVLVGRVEQRLPQLQSWIQTRQTIHLYANPSRLGLESEVSAWIAGETRVKKMAYLSCSPGTLARDLGVLQAGGFEVVRVTPFDFLPRTSAVEALALLQRRG